MRCLQSLLLFMVVLIHHTKCMESLYMKRSEIEDQASSASGYSYQAHTGGLLPYTAYAAADAPAGNQQGLNHFGYPPITLGRYTQELPVQLPLTAGYNPQAAPALNGMPLNSYGLPANPAAYALNPLTLEIAKYSPLPQPPAPIVAPVAVAQEEASKFAKGGGASFSAGNQNSHGEKGASGYKNIQQFEKGAQGKHANEGQKGYYSKEGGNKAGHHEEGQHFNKNEAAAQGAKGGSFHHSKSHKKGSKTTGFHRVHHKDEYKKDHTFYDEADNSGHFNKYGNLDAKFAAEKGGYAKGGHQQSAFQAGAHGAKGFSDKGRYVDQDSGYKGEQGKEAHYKDSQEYAKNGGQQAQSEHGYSEADGLSSYH